MADKKEEITTSHEVIDLSLDTVINTKLVQSNITEQVLVALKEKYGGLKLKSLDDKESYLEIKEAVKVVSKVRTITVKLCTEGRESAVAIQKKWIEKQKEIVARVAEVEDALDAEISRYDLEVTRKDNEEKELKEAAYINRQAQLTKMGAEYLNGSFVLAEASVEAAILKEVDNEIYEQSILPNFKVEFEIIQAKQIAEQKKKDEDAAELKRQQDELAKKQKEFDEKQAEMERKEKAAELEEQKKAQEKELEEAKRISEIQNKRFAELSTYINYGKELELKSIALFTDSEFAEILAEKKIAYEEDLYKKELDAEQKRISDIQKAKDDAILEEQEKQKNDAIKREQELDVANDKTKWADFLAQMENLKSHDMRSSQYRTKMKIAREKLAEIIAL